MADLELTDRYDDELLSVPWRVKADEQGKTYLFKYARHPDRTGYIVVVTDLLTVHYEVLFGPPLSARLRSSARLVLDAGGNEEGDDDDDDDPFEAVERGLSKLAALFDVRWDQVKVGVKDDRSYDLVMHLQSNGFAWIFNLTELRGRRPLSFITQQLIAPLTSLLAEDRQISLAGLATPLEQATRILANGQIQKGLRDALGLSAATVAGQGKGDLHKSRPSSKGGRAHRQFGSPATASTSASASASAVASASASPPPPTPSRKAHGRIFTHHRVNSSSSPPASKSASPSRSPSSARESKEKNATSKPISKNDRSKTSTAGVVSANIEDQDDGERIPTQLLSQKSKREREKEEDEEVERRMVEMRKKMASGGGGKLGRRRLAR